MDIAYMDIHLYIFNKWIIRQKFNSPENTQIDIHGSYI